MYKINFKIRVIVVYGTTDTTNLHSTKPTSVPINGLKRDIPLISSSYFSTAFQFPFAQIKLSESFIVHPPFIFTFTFTRLLHCLLSFLAHRSPSNCFIRLQLLHRSPFNCFTFINFSILQFFPPQPVRILSYPNFTDDLLHSLNEGSSPAAFSNSVVTGRFLNDVVSLLQFLLERSSPIYLKDVDRSSSPATTELSSFIYPVRSSNYLDQLLGGNKQRESHWLKELMLRKVC